MLRFYHFKNLHSGHKFIELNDIESLEKENITIESTTKEFNNISQKIRELKNKIENEINKISNLYESTIEDLTKSYLKKHELLLKEENDLKEILQNEVTKIKEKLEYFLSESNNEIKISERIEKGIKKMENEEKNMIKILSYVSKINKTQKNMNKLLASKMKNIKFKYEEEKNDIKYEEYIFNGITIPKNIEFKYISNLSINISWNVDDINKDDKDKIKYRIEMKKENEEFEKIYEGNNNNYSINNLSNNTNYEFRICSLLDNTMGEWSEIKKFKIIDFNCDSIILIESNRKNEFLKKIYEWSGYNKMELLFRGTRDGMTNKIFHNKCDNKGQTITLIKNEKGNIFGGYSSISWTSDGNFHSAPDSFLFTLTNNYNIEPTKFVSKIDQ